MNKIYLCLVTMLLSGAATATAANTFITELPGYQQSTVTANFADFLKANPQILAALRADANLSRHILSSPILQERLMAGRLNVDEFRPPSKADVATPDATISLQATQELQRTLQALQNPNTQKPSLAVPSSPSTVDIDAVLATLTNSSAPLPTPATTPPAPDAPAPHFINRAPQDTTALDANGWPQHLNVPTHCPAAESGRDYIFNMRISGRWNEPYQGTSRPAPLVNQPSSNVVNVSLNDMGPRSYFSLTDNEVYAVPFHTSTAEARESILSGGATLYEFARGLTHGEFQRIEISVAECPGVFDFNVQPNGVIPEAERRAVGLVSYSPDSNSTATVRVRFADTSYHAKPHTRYFYNIRTINHHGCQDMLDFQVSLGGSHANYEMRNGKPICTTSARLIFGHNHDHRVPYNGPCLSASAPKPENYSEITCQGSRLLTECIFAHRDNKPLRRYSCVDPTGQQPPETFELSCHNGAVAWTAGFQKPVSIGYVCARAWEDDTGVMTPFNEIATWHICSAATEGYRYRDDTQEYTCSYDSAFATHRWTGGGPNSMHSGNVYTYYDAAGNVLGTLPAQNAQ